MLLMLQALASQPAGNPARAMDALGRALALAEPGGFVRIFVNEGPTMNLLLHEVASRGIAPDYASRLLAASPVAESGLPASSVAHGPSSSASHHSSSPLIEPLSEREVVALIAEGLTNPEIAASLYLALNTVKAHTRNIYGKLDAHGRTQAIA